MASECLYCLSVDLVTDSGTVWSWPPAISRSGPRSSLWVSTLAWECGVKLAVADWKIGRPGDGIVQRSQSSSDSSSGMALPNP